jgi:FKBP-type peptidyl-prolyl cis-trans isomerase
MTRKNITSTIIILAVIGALAYFGFRPKHPLPINTNSTSMTTLDSGLQYEITKEGTGPVIVNGQHAVVNYTGRLADGTVFDSNVDRAFQHVSPFEFTLGSGMVIKGWDQGVLGMKVGEKRTLVIPAELAYGNRAIGSIPANSVLTFDVELTGIK